MRPQAAAHVPNLRCKIAPRRQDQIAPRHGRIRVRHTVPKAQRHRIHEAFFLLLIALRAVLRLLIAHWTAIEPDFAIFRPRCIVHGNRVILRGGGRQNHIEFIGSQGLAIRNLRQRDIDGITNRRATSGNNFK
jgi:hypothetical protein